MTQEEKRSETISGTAEVDYTHKKQIGGAGEFAKVRIRLEPLPRGTGIQFVNEAPVGVVPDEMVGGVEEGIREAAKTGVLEGGLIVDVKVTLIDGAYHYLDSDSRTFSLASQRAFLEGVRKAGPKLLLR